MKSRLPYLLVLGLLAFSGCQTTPFTPAAAQADYAVQDMGPDSFLIRYQGDGAASGERIFDFGLLRACHVAREHDFKYFAVVDQARSEPEQIVFASGDLIRNLSQPGLVIHGFTSRPRHVFVFEVTALERMIHDKYRAGTDHTAG
jgi:hypothetical protein